MHIILNHPLVADRMARMRDKSTPPSEFRRLVGEVAGFVAYEALRDLRQKDKSVETPVATAEGKVLDEPGMTIVPILRAGIGMMDAVREVVPGARVGVLGIKRNETTAEPVPYYSNVPCSKTGEELAIVVDPMLATGGSACDAIAQIKKLGYKRIKFLCLVSAPEGIARLETEHPDVEIFAAAKDERLNSRFYIVPGLGDAGDRIFGTLEP